MSERNNVSLPGRYGADTLVGDSDVMRDVRARIRAIASGRAPVLITGETGTGKEVAARALHAESERRAGPVLAINCGISKGELVASELFGHEAGAFTGANSSRRGAFRAADGGTLLLDEIGDLAQDSQAALLRVLEEGMVQPLGCDTPVPVDVRVLAATNRELAPGADSRTEFRSDLYYRLCGDSLVMPPLRTHLVDLAVLANHLLAQCTPPKPSPPPFCAQGALDALAAHAWPGNVRELWSVLRACWRDSGWAARLNAADIARVLPPASRVRVVIDRSAMSARTPHRPAPPANGAAPGLVPAGFNPRSRASPEKLLVFQRVLAHYHGDVGAAAAHLTMTREAFVRSLASLKSLYGDSATRA